MNADPRQTIVEFVEKASGLSLANNDTMTIELIQKSDTKSLRIELREVKEVLTRRDTDNSTFLQVNFSSGRKILLTDSFIGFKPVTLDGLDMSKIPRVVTTPDLMSVFEAIEDSMSSENEANDLDTLRKIFFAILIGGESVGFDLGRERTWVTYLAGKKASA